jgi:hypothetical protein
MNASFWLNRLENPEHIIANQSEIEDFNQKNIECLSANIHDITSNPVEIHKEKLYNLISEKELIEQKLYMDSKLLDEAYFGKLIREMDVENIGEKNIAYYGVTVRRTNMRILPTMDFVTNRPEDSEFDRLQQTAVSVAEPLQILHCSASEQWYFVQSYYASGWVPAAHIAIASREKWLEYALPEHFLVVTGNRLRLGFNPYSPEISELEFFMGDKLPLVCEKIPTTVNQQSTTGNYVIKLPVWQADGQMDSQFALVPVVSDISVGYLSYTRGNIIRQAFKMQGDRYGWGGSFGSRDCSSFVMDIYRIFGVRLPRNTWDQMRSVGKTIDFSILTAEERRQALQTMKPGATLYCKGHVMLYLGHFEEKDYIIHAIAESSDACKFKIDGILAVLPLYNIMVTDVLLLRTTGQTILEELIMGKMFE